MPSVPRCEPRASGDTTYDLAGGGSRVGRHLGGLIASRRRARFHVGPSHAPRRARARSVARLREHPPGASRESPPRRRRPARRHQEVGLSARSRPPGSTRALASPEANVQAHRARAVQGDHDLDGTGVTDAACPRSSGSTRRWRASSGAAGRGRDARRPWREAPGASPVVRGRVRSGSASRRRAADCR